MPEKSKNILKYKHNKKSQQIPHIIYAGLECLLRKIDLCQPSEGNSYVLKKNVHIPSGYSLNLVRNYDQNISTTYRAPDCMEKFVRSLKIMIMMITNTKQKRPTKLTDEETYNYHRSNKCYIYKKRFSFDSNSYDLNKVRDHCYYSGKYRGPVHKNCFNNNHEETEILVVFCNGSSYDYHFIINELAKNVDGIKCTGENSEKYISFKTLLNHEDSYGKLKIYKLKFIDSYRFIDSSLQKLVDNLSELNISEKCNQQCKNYKRQNNTLIYDCNECNTRSYKAIKSLIERFPNVYAFCNNNLDKFLLLLRNGVYPYEYMDNWSRFEETTSALIDKYSSDGNNSNLSKADYVHSNIVWTIFKIKNLGEYHDLYLQLDT